MTKSVDFLENISPTPAAYRAAARLVETGAAPDLKRLRVAVAASFTAEPLGNYLAVEAARRGFRLQLSFTPYSQFELECASPDSALFAGHPDIVVIATRLEDLVPALWRDYEATPDDARRKLVEEACGRVEQMIAGVRRHSAASVAAFNFTEPVRASWGVTQSPAALVAHANALLDAFCGAQPGVFVFDFARFVLDAGLRGLSDRRLDYISRMPFGTSAQIELARRLARWIRALAVPAAKCLVLDLDNTLWGGILGEVGPGGIGLGHDYPGSVFRDFQFAVRGLRHRGILLAIASKNNEAEVQEVFATHPDMVLRWEDFAAAEIHWRDKAASLRVIAGKLRIGLDALVFYDDNPVEREWVRSQLPEVHVIEVPDDLLLRVPALDDCELFDQVTVSAEDRLRASLYEQDRRREQVARESASLADFLSRLEIRATTGTVDEATLPRVVQLINKTNQFNLTGRRSSEAVLQAQLNAGAIGCWIRTADRFGDYGLVGAAIAVPETQRDWRIDNFVVSCRILGRQVEKALLAALARRVAEHGAQRLIGDYIPTSKNSPARDFYSNCGLQPDGGRWLWDFTQGCPASPAHLALNAPAEVAAVE